MTGGVPDSQLLTLPGWPGGIDNVHAEFDVPAAASRDGTTIARLREAVNVDVDDNGKVSRRPGYALAIASDNAHSLWSDPEYHSAFAVLDGALTAIDEYLGQTVLRTGMSHIHPVSYCVVNGVVFWSNRQVSGRVTEDLEAKPFALPSPAGQPNVAANTEGGLSAGDYQVAITYKAMSGEESGTSLAVLVTIEEGQGVRITNVPQPPSGSGIVAIRVYMSTCNGDVLYHQRDLAVGMTSATLAVAHTGKALETQWLQPMPPGQIVRYFNGRVYVAQGRVLWWSEALRYGYYNPSYNYVTFPADITLVAPVGDADAGGIYVAAGTRTYFMQGADPKAMRRVIAYPHNAVPGTHVEVPASLFGGNDGARRPFWLAANGVFCIGTPSGQVEPQTETYYVAPHAERGAAILRERNGKRQIIVGLGGQQTNVFRATDSVVATVYRNGVAIGE